MSSKYIISDKFKSSNTILAKDWTFSISSHQAPKGEKWGKTNQLEYGVQHEIVATDLIANPTIVTNMDMKTTKSGKQYELGKFDVPIFCAVKWADKTGSRSITKVESVSAMVFDFDGLTDDQTAETLVAFEGLCHIAYTSYSNKAPYKNDLHAFRVIVALDRPVLPEEYADQYKRGMWFALESIFPHLDQATKDPCRFWFMPSYRVDRESDYFAYAEDGAMLLVDQLLEQSDQQRTTPTEPSNTTEQTPNGEQVPNGEPPQEEAPQADDGRYIQTVVRDDHPVTCHDLQVRPFSWVITNWDSLPKQTNGRYNCCRPNSTTIGSAFVSRTAHPRHLVARYRLTSVPNRTHHDCDRTDHGIALQYENRGGTFRPVIDVPNTIKMIAAMNPNLYLDARTDYSYYEGKLIIDSKYTVIQGVLQDQYRMQFNRSIVQTATENYCEMNSFDSLKTYLENLQWDGVQRADELFIKYLKANDTNIHRVYARKWLISCVARALSWGCKVDTMVILKGLQGLRKSGFFKALAGTCSRTGNSYFADEPTETSGTDGLSKLRLAWIHEWAELSGMSKKESGEVKQFLSKTTDRYRRKYDRKEMIKERHCVLVGTVNNDQIFQDDTGSRRFWAVECNGEEHKEAYDEKDLVAIRDQIWAEAVHYYKQGEQWWLTYEEQVQSAETNSKFDSVSIHEELIETWLLENQGRTFSFEDLMDEVYMEAYTLSDGTVAKRNKAIKPPNNNKWHKTILVSLGCLQLNDGKSARHNGKIGRWWVAPTVDVAEIVSVSNENYELEFNDDNTVKRVRKFGQEWIPFESMSEQVQADWMKRYPKRDTKIRNFPDKQERMFRQ